MPAPEKYSPTKIEWLAAALITVTIVWLHFHFWQNAGALWRDEVNTVNLAQSPSLAALAHDTFPVLSPLAVKLWSAFGHSDLWLRFLGLLCGLLFPLAFWLVARATRRPPLFSLLLFGLNPLLIIYGDSLRAYGPGSALLTLSLAAMLAFLNHPTWPRAAILALTATLAVQTLFQNSLLFFAICLGAFTVCVRRKDFAAGQKIFCAGTLAAVSLLPYVPNFFALQTAAVELRRGFSMFITSLNFNMATAFPFEPFTAVWKMLAVLVIGLALFSLARKKSTDENGSQELPIFAGVTLLAVVVLFLAFLKFAAAGARSWYFLPPLALTAACFDFGIPLMQLPRLARVSVFAIVIGTALISVTFAQSDLHAHFTNADQLAAEVKKSSSPKDFVVVTPWFCGITFERYFHSETPWTTLPPLTDHATHRYDLVLKQMLDTNTLAPVLEKISATLRAGQRVWVVGLMELPAPNSSEPPELPPPPLPDYGWSDTPYMGSWRDRTAFFLARHSQKFEAVNLSDDGIPKLQENLRLFRAEGWRD